MRYTPNAPYYVLTGEKAISRKESFPDTILLLDNFPEPCRVISLEEGKQALAENPELVFCYRPGAL